MDKRKKLNLVIQLSKKMGISEFDAKYALYECHYDLKAAIEYVRREKSNTR